MLAIVAKMNPALRVIPYDLEKILEGLSVFLKDLDHDSVLNVVKWNQSSLKPKRNASCP